MNLLREGLLFTLVVTERITFVAVKLCISTTSPYLPHTATGLSQPTHILLCSGCTAVPGSWQCGPEGLQTVAEPGDAEGGTIQVSVAYVVGGALGAWVWPGGSDAKGSVKVDCWSGWGHFACGELTN